MSWDVACHHYVNSLNFHDTRAFVVAGETLCDTLPDYGLAKYEDLPKPHESLTVLTDGYKYYLRAYARQPARGPSKGMVAVVVVFVSWLWW